MKISASIYSNKHQTLSDTVRELDEHFIDFFHLDCNDDPRVFDDIEAIHRRSSTPVDLHIISSTPAQYFELLRKTPVSRVSFQLEPFGKIVQFPADLPGQIGLALMNDTPVDAFVPYAERCSFVLLMTTTPGHSGGIFNKDTFQKIRQFRKLFPTHQIQVDGGVNAEVSFILRNLGVESAVVGSFLFQNKSVGPALLHLKREVVSSHYLIKDFMIETPELPILDVRDLTFKNALLTIEKYEMAFVLITDNGKLKGIISNADVRKGLIKNFGNLNNTNAFDLINSNPIVIEENKTIDELLGIIRGVKFPLQYIPVVNSDGDLTGALTFTQMIKAET
ncbi:MAG: CBS domain-containing protein [Saprospiraceae bacterium]|nr:CBS domain-containing protein [Saprospiraceae bacterium]MCF8248626.1 CBS domain-containing protein [Saprospiraceae bacterium]MCF8282968.1 CBS domain-containing protein [Bacteroidales bacterium]MCF8310359.1 CBS domain-containing protein [Saprospiraceae bacterium]MCF8442060.1 CBS domain-containing protein [Saprospiraceae bacterium]